MASGRVGCENVKVVLIDTQYVVTDSASFKSVVQSLTGKDSCVAWIEESSFNGKENERAPGYGRIDQNLVRIEGDGGVGDGRLSKGFSFKDLDGMILELSSVEEWQQLLLESNFVQH